MIRKILFTLTICLLSADFLNAQVFNTAETLKPLNFSVGIAPIYYNENFGLLLMGEAGIKQDIDFNLRYAILEYEDYFGADLEWKLLNRNSFDLSLTTGCHVYYDFGLDASGNISFRIRDDVALYSGLDIDLNFGNDLYVPLWIPVGVEINLSRSIAFLFEAELPLSRPANAIIDGGLSFRF
jgi:hypothetical protein